MAALALADRKPFGITATHIDNRLRHQRVVNDHIGFHQHALRAQRQQVFRTGTGADEPDAAFTAFGRLQQAVDGLTGGRGIADGDRIRDRAGKEPAPEIAAQGALRHIFLSGIAILHGETRKLAERRRQHLVDAGADHLGKNRPRPFRADGDGDWRTGDKRGGEEIAEFRLIHRIGGNFRGAGNGDDLAIQRLVSGGGKDQRRALKQPTGESQNPVIDTVFPKIAGKIRFRLIRVNDDMCIGIGEKPYLRESLVAISENSNLPSLNPEECGEG
ncbi:hypothetical protein D3C80_834420 [compost metagenome]